MKKIFSFIVTGVVVIAAIFGIGSFVKNYNKEESFKNNLEQQVNGVFKDWFNKGESSTDENQDLSGDVNGSVDLPNTDGEDTSATSIFSYTLTDEQLSRIQAGSDFYYADGVEYATWSEYSDGLGSGYKTTVCRLNASEVSISFNINLSLNWDEIPYSEVSYITYLTVNGEEQEVTWTRSGTASLDASSYPSIFSYFQMFTGNLEIRISPSDMIKSISLDRIVYVPNNNEILYENN